MLRFKAIKEFADTLSDSLAAKAGNLVFPPPYETVLKTDSVLEIFYPRGCAALSNYIRDNHDFLVPPGVLETITFSHLLDIVNGPKDLLGCIPPEFDPVTHFQTTDTGIEITPYKEPEYLDGGFVNPLWVKDKLHDESRDIMVKKNHDYRGGSNDPYANFRGSREFDIHPVIGILLRCQDKFKRIKTFVEKGELMVKDESIKDAVLDVHNYMDLIYGLIKEAQEGGSNVSK